MMDTSGDARSDSSASMSGTSPDEDSNGTIASLPQHLDGISGQVPLYLELDLPHYVAASAAEFLAHP